MAAAVANPYMHKYKKPVSKPRRRASSSDVVDPPAMIIDENRVDPTTGKKYPKRYIRGKLLGNPDFKSLATGLAHKYHFNSTAPVALAYVAQRGIPLVTKSNNPTYLAEDLALFGADSILDATDRARLDALTAPGCSAEAPGGCCKDGEHMHI